VESEHALVRSFIASAELKNNTFFSRDFQSIIKDINLSLIKIDEFIFDNSILDSIVSTLVFKESC